MLLKTSLFITLHRFLFLMKQLVFLYPIARCFDRVTLENINHLLEPTEPLTLDNMGDVDAFMRDYRERKAMFRQAEKILTAQLRPMVLGAYNQVIEERYRQNGFEISFLLPKEDAVDRGILLHKSDKVLPFPFPEACDEPYPSADLVLDRLGSCDILVVAGFHYGDCIDRFAFRALEKSFPTVVDVELTDLLLHDMYCEEGFAAEKFMGTMEYCESINDSFYKATTLQRPWHPMYAFFKGEDAWYQQFFNE